ncbi:hypothetical protein BH11BAC3_BH11BAC3_42080 [soil metagenome]
MTKFFFLVAFGLVTNATFGQDLNDIKKFAILGKIPQAKEAVDKFLAVPKNADKAEAWYYKAYVYNSTSKDSTLPIADAEALKATAFEAAKKYRELDPKAPLLAETNNSTLFDLYVGYYSDLGVKAYMAKDPKAAFENFEKGLVIHDYIVANDLTGANNFKFSSLDTTLVLYTAISANEAKQKEAAAKYYQKIVDAGISDPQYIDAYQFLADHYKVNKNREGFANVIEKGKKFYPTNNEYWIAMEIEEATDGVEKPGLFTKYDELMVKNPGNYTLPYNYGVELYRYIYDDEMKDSNMVAYKTKLIEVMNKAIGIKSTLEANFLLANFLYNNSIDLSEEARKMKGTKPDDLKKKKEIQTKSDAQMNESVPYAEKVVSMFAAIEKPKTSEKINYKQSLTILKSVASEKKEVAKVAEYDKLIKAAEY